jgi:nitrite reductase/ring-hydroxylating ferredoxin subunit
MTEPLSRQEISEKAYSLGRDNWESWPVYEAAETGLGNYWYPVLWSRDVRKKPIAVQVMDEQIVLIREGDLVFALNDRCPHRGVPLHFGSREFPNTITCVYHGWTYELESGLMCAAITDGPDSPISCKAAVKTYPVAERFGLIWVFIGDLADDDIPPLEDDLPDEMVDNPVVVVGKIQSGREGNWRYAAENGFDEGHAKFLHRNSVWAGFRQMPVWTMTKILKSDDEKWLSRQWTEVHWDAEFPGLGTWTQRRWWKRTTPSRPSDKKGVDPVIDSLDLPGVVSVRLPYLLRVAYSKYIHYEWAIAEGPDFHRYVQLLVSFQRGLLKRLWFKLKYLLFIRWAFHTQFTGQDAWMVDVMDVPPERLYRPDSSVISYRRLVEKQYRKGPE